MEFNEISKSVHDSLSNLKVYMYPISLGVLAVGFSFGIQKASDAAQMGNIIIKTVIILCIIANLDELLNAAQTLIADICDAILPGYSKNPLDISKKIFCKEIYEAYSDEGVFVLGFKNLLNSLFVTVVQIGILVSSFFQVILFIIQDVILTAGEVISIVFTSMFIFPNLSSLGSRFWSEYLAVLMWPVGFAIINGITLAILKDMTNENFTYSNTTMGTGPATICICFLFFTGTILVPPIMHSLFSYGTGIGQAVSSVMGSTSGLIGHIGGSISGGIKSRAMDSVRVLKEVVKK